MINKKIAIISVLSVALVACSKQESNVEVTSMEVFSPQSLQRAKQQPSPLHSQSVLFDVNGSKGIPNLESAQQLSENSEKYQHNEINPIQRVEIEPISTFSIDVDTGSYANVRRFLESEDRLPPVDAVRLEELINYFDYNYGQPKGQHPFMVNVETANSPWMENAKIIRIGIKAKDINQKELPASNLVFLVDVSGSMDEQNKLPLVKKTLKILTEQLRPQDKVTIVTYASGEEVVLAPTSGKDKDKILTAIDKLNAGGATSGQKAIELAYDQAEKSFIKNGINRILIATDGDFNVGMVMLPKIKQV